MIFIVLRFAVFYRPGRSGSIASEATVEGWELGERGMLKSGEAINFYD